MDIYKYDLGGVQLVRDEAKELWHVDRMEIEGGIKIYMTGCQFPKKSMPTPETISAINQIKRLLLTTLKTFHIFILFIRPQKLIKSFNSIAFPIIRPYVLKQQYQTVFAKEFKNLLALLLGDYEGGKETAEIISQIFEYDEAYRIRLQDLFSETTKEKLIKNPRKEIKRLLEIQRQREYDYGEINGKFKLFSHVLNLALLSPKLKRKFREALEKINLENLCLDEADLYWLLQRIDYNWNNLPFKEREDMLKLKGWSTVKAIPVNQ